MSNAFVQNICMSWFSFDANKKYGSQANGQSMCDFISVFYYFAYDLNIQGTMHRMK